MGGDAPPQRFSQNNHKIESILIIDDWSFLLYIL